MFKKLKDIEVKYTDLESLLSDSDVISRQPLYQKYARSMQNSMIWWRPIGNMRKFTLWWKKDKRYSGENDEELKSIVKEEMPQLREQLNL